MQVTVVDRRGAKHVITDVNRWDWLYGPDLLKVFSEKGTIMFKSPSYMSEVEVL